MASLKLIIREGIKSREKSFQLKEKTFHTKSFIRSIWKEFNYNSDIFSGYLVGSNGMILQFDQIDFQSLKRNGSIYTLVIDNTHNIADDNVNGVSNLRYQVNNNVKEVSEKKKQRFQEIISIEDLREIIKKKLKNSRARILILKFGKNEWRNPKQLVSLLNIDGFPPFYSFYFYIWRESSMERNERSFFSFSSSSILVMEKNKLPPKELALKSITHSQYVLDNIRELALEYQHASQIKDRFHKNNQYYWGDDKLPKKTQKNIVQTNQADSETNILNSKILINDRYNWKAMDSNIFNENQNQVKNQRIEHKQIGKKNNHSNKNDLAAELNNLAIKEQPRMLMIEDLKTYLISVLQALKLGNMISISEYWSLSFFLKNKYEKLPRGTEQKFSKNQSSKEKFMILKSEYMKLKREIWDDIEFNDFWTILDQLELAKAISNVVKNEWLTILHKNNHLWWIFKSDLWEFLQLSKFGVTEFVSKIKNIIENRVSNNPKEAYMSNNNINDRPTSPLPKRQDIISYLMNYSKFKFTPAEIKILQNLKNENNKHFINACDLFYSDHDEEGFFHTLRRIISNSRVKSTSNFNENLINKFDEEFERRGPNSKNHHKLGESLEGRKDNGSYHQNISSPVNTSQISLDKTGDSSFQLLSVNSLTKKDRFFSEMIMYDKKDDENNSKRSKNQEAGQVSNPYSQKLSSGTYKNEMTLSRFTFNHQNTITSQHDGQESFQNNSYTYNNTRNNNDRNLPTGWLSAAKVVNIAGGVTKQIQKQGSAETHKTIVPWFKSFMEDSGYINMSFGVNFEMDNMQSDGDSWLPSISTTPKNINNKDINSNSNQQSRSLTPDKNDGKLEADITKNQSSVIKPSKFLLETKNVLKPQEVVNLKSFPNNPLKQNSVEVNQTANIDTISQKFDKECINIIEAIEKNSNSINNDNNQNPPANSKKDPEENPVFKFHVIGNFESMENLKRDKPDNNFSQYQLNKNRSMGYEVKWHKNKTKKNKNKNVLNEEDPGIEDLSDSNSGDNISLKSNENSTPNRQLIPGTNDLHPPPPPSPTAVITPELVNHKLFEILEEHEVHDSSKDLRRNYDDFSNKDKHYDNYCCKDVGNGNGENRAKTTEVAHSNNKSIENSSIVSPIRSIIETDLALDSQNKVIHSADNAAKQQPIVSTESLSSFLNRKPAIIVSPAHRRRDSLARVRDVDYLSQIVHLVLQADRALPMFTKMCKELIKNPSGHNSFNDKLLKFSQSKFMKMFEADFTTSELEKIFNNPDVYKSAFENYDHSKVNSVQMVKQNLRLLLKENGSVANSLQLKKERSIVRNLMVDRSIKQKKVDTNKGFKISLKDLNHFWDRQHEEPIVQSPTRSMMSMKSRGPDLMQENTNKFYDEIAEISKNIMKPILKSALVELLKDSESIEIHPFIEIQQKALFEGLDYMDQELISILLMYDHFKDYKLIWDKLKKFIKTINNSELISVIGSPRGIQRKTHLDILKSILRHFLDLKYINSFHYSILYGMLSRENENLIGAFELYCRTLDKKEFANTLLIIYMIESSIGMEEILDEHKENQYNVMFLNKRLFNSDIYTHLIGMIQKGDSKVSKRYEEYNDHKTIKKFVQDLSQDAKENIRRTNMLKNASNSKSKQWKKEMEFMIEGFNSQLKLPVKFEAYELIHQDVLISEAIMDIYEFTRDRGDFVENSTLLMYQLLRNYMLKEHSSKLTETLLKSDLDVLNLYYIIVVDYPSGENTNLNEWIIVWEAIEDDAELISSIKLIYKIG